MLNFTFGGNTDLTYEELQARRRIAERLATPRATPRNVGEGLNRIGEAIAYRMISRRNRTAEERLREEADAQWGEFMDTFMGGSGGAGGGAGGYGGTTGSTRSFTGPATANAAGVMEAVSGNTDAPTAGLRYMLPAENPDEMDPRGGAFATGASRSDDPNIYTTSVTGATGGVSPEIIDIVGNSVEQAYGPGAAVGVSSGHRPGSRGSQHSAGNALDFNVTDRAGRRSSYADPRIYDAARVAAAQGASGVGIGPNYMGGETFHFDTGQGGATAPNFGSTVRTWSDWNTSGPRGASDPGGAGDPSIGFRAELQGIRDGAQPTRGTVGPVLAQAPGGLTATASAQNRPSGGSGGAQDPRAMIAALLPVLNNPMLSDGQRMVAGALMQQALGQAFAGPPDPMDAIELETAQLELEMLRREMEGGSQVDPFGPDAGVRSSEILPDGTTIQSTDYGIRVIAPTGEFLEGEDAAEAIRSAQEYGVLNQQEIYGARRTGTNLAETATGGAAAAAGAQGSALGTATAEAGVEAWTQSRALRGTLSTYDEAIAALDAGADAGAIANRLPRFDLEGATLQNAMDRLGLDVIGSVTFGALSEGELRLAMQTAVPRNLDGPQLREWLARRRVALERSAAMLENAAEYLTTPGNTINGWIERNQGQADAPADATSGGPEAPRQSWADLTPNVQAALRDAHTEAELRNFFEDYPQ